MSFFIENVRLKFIVLAEFRKTMCRSLYVYIDRHFWRIRIFRIFHLTEVSKLMRLAKHFPCERYYLIEKFTEKIVRLYINFYREVIGH